ncbi:MAG: hypothetical protein WBD20_14545 [Pirellulaceae bacterium]
MTTWLTIRPLDTFVSRVLVEKKIESESAEEENLIACLEVRTAGDPDKEDVFSTHMTPREFLSRLADKGTPTGRDSITTWLNDAGIRHRQIAKVLPGGEHENRNAQFGRIGELIELYESDRRACSGMLFDTLDCVVELLRRAHTSTGLKTTANVIRRMYETKRNATEQMKRRLRIQYDDFLSKWNFVATPKMRH